MRPWLCAVVLLVAAPAMAGQVQPLTTGDVATLLKPPSQGVKVIEFWALDCAYCEANMKAVAALETARVILVATDNIAHAAALNKRLADMGVSHLPARAYAGASRQRLDYLIDPNWGGITPRTLVIHADGTRRSAVGALTPQRLQTLVATSER
ncbi:MAG TPA: hypothetical protein VFJ15_08705 [Oleiagrimonas sp.]|nr:hypothetical protein [Oleiagrimonas sp.]